ncbi:hydantoin utilization protein A [Prochlorococcus sp. MIT 1307]|uniref:hydantoin utilization protein A n=1 Tax=Prochlorococcus sp. MIT 1307 TaxID=3096219 RepID=UPI002A74FD44|nr:hydantoin utilization protein A [Prochlorococcus sp. MIT 1307]
MLISIVTGIAAGALHVVGGVDHLVALAPVALRSPRIALRNGLAWGLGHSAGVMLLSMIAILVKDLAHIERMSSWAEFSVGIALLVVGLLAIRTALGLNIHTHNHVHNHSNGYEHDHLHLHFRGRQKHNRHPHAVTSLGVLHGLAGASHLLAVIPALALPPLGAAAYMVAYLIGSVATMGAFLVAISLTTMRAGRKAFPFIVGSAGGLSVLTGIFWLQKTSSLII